MFVAIIANKKVKAEPEVVANVQKYLSRAAATAKYMLPETTSALGDCFTGEDDSDNEVLEQE